MYVNGSFLICCLFVSATSMVIAGLTVFFLPLIHNKTENLLISCVFGAVSTVGWNALDVLQAELFPTAVRYVHSCS